jgi:hypothetical protein
MVKFIQLSLLIAIITISFCSTSNLRALQRDLQQFNFEDLIKELIKSNPEVE